MGQRSEIEYESDDFNAFQLVSFVSAIMTLMPGDIIAHLRRRKLKVGDVVEVEMGNRDTRTPLGFGVGVWRQKS